MVTIDKLMEKEINDITMYKGDCLEVMDRLIVEGVDRVENV